MVARSGGSRASGQTIGLPHFGAGARIAQRMSRPALIFIVAAGLASSAASAAPVDSTRRNETFTPQTSSAAEPLRPADQWAPSALPSAFALFPPAPWPGRRAALVPGETQPKTLLAGGVSRPQTTPARRAAVFSPSSSLVSPPRVVRFQPGRASAGASAIVRVSTSVSVPAIPTSGKK